ncbi:hypothetical protein [Martelella mediterranea]|uniref:Uncharacterized protein n=1 Tax=Martelella mediterranea TaxID=293089 RepID=A0A4R3NIS9_9HYPH|nr:hypothetical protein [Martelella mediterranea]TCT28177.1 hypothetical protein EDC90_10655 [Martelella mediterranea]
MDNLLKAHKLERFCDASEGVRRAGRYADAFSGAMIYNLAAVLVAVALLFLIAHHGGGTQQSGEEPAARIRWKVSG